jgi:hypothetical protein
MHHSSGNGNPTNGPPRSRRLGRGCSLLFLFPWGLGFAALGIVGLLYPDATLDVPPLFVLIFGLIVTGIGSLGYLSGRRQKRGSRTEKTEMD